MRARSLYILKLAFLLVFSPSAGASSCVEEQIRANLLGAQFLHGLNPNFHHTPMVDRAQELLMELGDKSPQSAQKKIAAWLSIIEQTHLGRQDSPQVLERLKNYYYREHVIKETDFPESYFDLQKKIAREQGHGNIAVSPEQRSRFVKVAIDDQKISLNPWVEYLASSDAAYPMWAKVWAFNGMTRIGKLDAETGHVTTRTRETVAPFVELNREALALTIEAVERRLLVKHQGRNYAEAEPDAELREVVKTGNFGQIYGWFQHKLTRSAGDLKVTEGAWVKYPKGSDPEPLVESLYCKNTGWCTAGKMTAKSQLQAGDFYVYYSNNAVGRPKNPRIAIRMTNDQIAEVRGIGPTQSLDPAISSTDILGQKLKEFGEEGERYQKRSSDMKRLSELEQKHEALEEFTESDVRFLYEMDSKIEGFGYERDPRIAELRKKRDEKKDLSIVFHVKPEEISLTVKDALSGKIKIHYGDLDLSDLIASPGLELPEVVYGDVKLGSVEALRNIKPSLNDRIDNLFKLKRTRGVRLPRKIYGRLELNRLMDVKGLKFPEFVRDKIFLFNLQSNDGFVLSSKLKGHLLAPKGIEPKWVDDSSK